jgi:hypothetical protein
MMACDEPTAQHSSASIVPLRLTQPATDALSGADGDEPSRRGRAHRRMRSQLLQDEVRWAVSGSAAEATTASRPRPRRRRPTDLRSEPMTSRRRATTPVDRHFRWRHLAAPVPGHRCRVRVACSRRQASSEGSWRRRRRHCRRVCFVSKDDRRVGAVYARPKQIVLTRRMAFDERHVGFGTWMAVGGCQDDDLDAIEAVATAMNTSPPSKTA